jgi:hypothetical protein
MGLLRLIGKHQCIHATYNYFILAHMQITKILRVSSALLPTNKF